MDQGTDGGVHFWLGHGIPNGYGSYVNPNSLPTPTP